MATYTGRRREKLACWAIGDTIEAIVSAETISRPRGFCIECLARAGDVGNGNSHRIDRRAGLLPLAAARRATCQSGLALARELLMYACEIKETANGSRRRACGKAW